MNDDAFLLFHIIFLLYQGSPELASIFMQSATQLQFMVHI